LITWSEEGGPKVSEPTRRGFGSSLLEKGLPNADVKREFRVTGVICTIDCLLE